jgi:hypothetical protein
MSHRPAVQTTALPTVPPANFNEWAEHIYSSLREGYPDKWCSATVDREDNSVVFYDQEGDEVRSASLDAIMGDTRVEVFAKDGNGPADYSSEWVKWYNLSTDMFRETCENAVKEWAKHKNLDVDSVEFC